VATSAANYVAVVDGQLMTLMETSASAPTFTSLVAKINDARLRDGKRTVGFMNPVLYSNGHLMDDVTEGSNYRCGGEVFRAG
jgi:tripeptidyl-peptidase-1